LYWFACNKTTFKLKYAIIQEYFIANPGALWDNCLMTEQEIQAKIKRIDEIYAQFHVQLGQLKTQQSDIIAEFIKNLEAAKLQELRKVIDNQ
jgi:archaellum biogenesis protein FlaJ (TadC family)